MPPNAVSSTHQIDQRILTLLERERRPLALSAISVEVGRPLDQVSDSLRRLTSSERIEKTSNGWRLRAQAPQGSPQPPAPGPLGARLPKDSTEHSRWSEFRRLCNFYADCVQLEERAHIQARLTQGSSDYLPLQVAVKWQALAEGKPYFMALHDDLESFLARAQGRPLMLGAPLDVLLINDKETGDVVRLASPVFTVHVVPKRDGSTLQLWPTRLVEINHGWLGRRVKNGQKRKELLEAIGLAPLSIADEDQSELWTVDSVDRASRALFATCRKWFKEFPDLSKMDTRPKLMETQESGIYNRAGIFVAPKLKFAKRLRSELLSIANVSSDEQLDQTALRFLFPHTMPPQQESPADPDPRSNGDPLIDFKLLAADQRLACESARKEPLTVITGPPGTGKSLVVSHIMANAALSGRSALFASRNHQAIEAVEPRLNALSSPQTIVLRPTRPWGEPGAQFDWFRAISDLLTRPESALGLEHAQSSVDELYMLCRARDRLESQLGSRSDAEDTMRQAERTISEAFEGRPADWCAAVWAAKPQEPQPDWRRVEDMRDRLAEPSSGLFARILLRFLKPMFASRLLRTALVARGHLVASSSDLDRLIPRPERGDLASVDRFVDEAGIVVRALATIEALRCAQMIIDQLPDCDKVRSELQSIRQKIEVVAPNALREIAARAGADLSSQTREVLATIRAACRNRPEDLRRANTKAAELFRSVVKDLLSHFSLWAVSNLSVSKALPLQPGCFNLAIIDEASQCDIASVVPVLYRARCAVVVGDGKQLSHVTRIGRETEMRLRETHGVDDMATFERFSFAANSFFDLASTSLRANRISLQNHFRCDPEIADYCNSCFYHGSLRVRTDLESLRERIGGAFRQSCLWTHVDGDSTSASTGAISKAQVDAIMEEVIRLQSVDFRGTLGVITPFRAQASRIRDRLTRDVPMDIREGWALAVDTVDGFQGDERDVIIFSLVGDRQTPEGALRFLAAEQNRFNVAVSRAKAVLHVFGDAQWAGSSGIPFIAELQRRCAAPAGAARRNELIGPVWEPKVAAALRARGFDFEQQYPTAGYYLDFAMFPHKRKVAIEIDGEAYHKTIAGDRVLDDIYRDLILETHGWELLRIWVYELREDFDECIDRIERFVAG